MIEFAAMGTVVAVHADPEAERAVRARFAEVEECASRFEAGSELSRLNADPRAEVPVSPLLAALLRAAHAAYVASNGLLDPTVCERLEAWGYDRTFAEVADVEAVPAPGRVPGFAHVRLGDGTVTRPPGVRLDLGGTGKAWTVDACADLVTDGYVNAGGDARAFGACTVRAHVHDAWDQLLGTIPLHRAALAASGTTRRRWKVAGGVAHHLVDPRTGAPAASDAVSATMVAGTACAAESAARAAVLLGVADGLAAVGAWPDVHSGAVVGADGAVWATAGFPLEPAALGVPA